MIINHFKVKLMLLKSTWGYKWCGDYVAKLNASFIIQAHHILDFFFLENLFELVFKMSHNTQKVHNSLNF